MNKFVVTIMVMAATIFGFGMVAEAQYGGGDNTATPSPTTVVPGGTVTVTISGCTDGETLTITLEGATTTATCAAGTAVASLPAPTTSGTYTGTVTGTAGFSATFQIVVAASEVPGGGLPATGSGAIDTTTGIALGLLVVGFGLFVVAQMRRRQAPTAA